MSLFLSLSAALGCDGCPRAVRGACPFTRGGESGRLALTLCGPRTALTLTRFPLSGLLSLLLLLLRAADARLSRALTFKLLGRSHRRSFPRKTSSVVGTVP